MEQQYKRPESALIIVYDEGKNVLLLRRRKPEHFWQSPAGSLDWGEEARPAAIRELHEETGLSADGMSNCQAVNHFIIYPMWRDRYAPGVIENTEYVFFLKLDKPCDIALDSHEHIEYRWLDYERSLRLITSYTNKEMLRRWVN